MIEIKEAISRSYEALKDMALLPETTRVELEEAELEEDGKVWVVTFSYPEPSPGTEPVDAGPNLRAILGNRRGYKAIRLQASDGSIRGVKSLHV
jgi:hypothetical protein